MGEPLVRRVEHQAAAEHRIDCEPCDNFDIKAEDAETRAKRIRRCMTCRWPLLFAELKSLRH